MKKIFLLFAVSIMAVAVISAQSPNVKYNPVGKWQFEAPYAPEGFTSGTFELALTDAKYSGTMAFTGSDYKIPCEQIKFENDILKFVIYVQDSDVVITLKFESESKMSGKAVHSEGEVPLSLTKTPDKK